MKALTRYVEWKAIPIAGLAGGTAYLLLMLALLPVTSGAQPVLMLRYFASLVMGQEVITQESAASLVVGILVHYVLSIFFALVIAIVVHRWGMLVGIVGGAVLGLSFYGINLYTMTLIFPWFFAMHGVLLAAAHVLYGAVAGGVYEIFDHYDEGLKPAGEVA
ncbi:MAG: hypothetical protein AAF787_10110 [Chloroflexota bacterium]